MNRGKLLYMFGCAGGCLVAIHEHEYISAFWAGLACFAAFGWE